MVPACSLALIMANRHGQPPSGAVLHLLWPQCPNAKTLITRYLAYICMGSKNTKAMNLRRRLGLTLAVVEEGKPSAGMATEVSTIISWLLMAVHTHE